MSLHERSPRIVMTTTFVQLVTVASSSVWFAMSVVALCIAVIMPFTRRKLPPMAARAQIKTPVFIRGGPQSPLPPSARATVTVPKDGNYHIALDHDAGVPRRSIGRRSVPTAIAVVPPVFGAITIVARPDRPDLAVKPTLGPPIIEESQEELTESALSDFETEARTPAISPEAAILSAESSKKTSLPQRVTSIFRRKNKFPSSAGEKSARSRTRSLSPVRKLLPDIRSDGEESATARRRLPYNRMSSDSVVLESKFVNPFKRKAKRSGRAYFPNTPELASPPLPSPPETPPMGHQRHRSFVSYFNKAMHPLHDTSADSSPRRSSMSSFATRSDASSSSASSYYSYSLLSASPSSRSPILSERSTNRTQPYSAPYYAAMPTPQPRRSSSARKVVEIRQPISEGEEPLEERTQSSLSGLEAGSLARGRAVAGDCVSDTEVAHKRRYRFIDDGRDQAR